MRKNKKQPREPASWILLTILLSLPILSLSKNPSHFNQIRLLAEGGLPDVVVLLIILVCLILAGLCIGYSIHRMNPEAINADDPNLDPNALPNGQRENTEDNIQHNNEEQIQAPSGRSRNT